MRRRLVTTEDMSEVFAMAKTFDKISSKLSETINAIASQIETVAKTTETTGKRMSKAGTSLKLGKLEKLDLSQPIGELKRLSASLLELNGDMEEVCSSKENLTESDWTFYRQWLVKNDFAPASDNDQQVSVMHESYESVKDMVDALAFALQNRNDEILTDGSIMGDRGAQSRYMREHDGMLSENIGEEKYNELLSEFKRWQERRNILGAVIGVEDERNNVQTQINKRRKYLDVYGGEDNSKQKKPTYSISAVEKPKSIVKGGLQDIRGSYSNAQSKASRIQSDFEIGLIGKDEALRQVDELNRELEGLGAGLKPIKIDVDSKAFSKAMGTIKDAWGGIQGIGSGVESITDALEGDKNAWEAISGVVSGFISIAEGVQAIVAIVQLLTTATHAHTAAKAAEATATGASTAAAATDATGKAVDAAATIPVIATNKLATASFLELASASYFAAHAYIPFAGFGIAAGFTSAAVAMTEAVGTLAFATGGIVPGTSRSGDKVIARVNSGEMILNSQQQARLFAIANGAAVYGEALAVGGEWQDGMKPQEVKAQLQKLQRLAVEGQTATEQNIKLRVRGRDLIQASGNELRSTRKRSNLR